MNSSFVSVLNHVMSQTGTVFENPHLLAQPGWKKIACYTTPIGLVTHWKNEDGRFAAQTDFGNFLFTLAHKYEEEPQHGTIVDPIECKDDAPAPNAGENIDKPQPNRTSGSRRGRIKSHPVESHSDLRERDAGSAI